MQDTWRHLTSVEPQTKAERQQSGFYPVQMNIAKGKPLHSLFNTQEEKLHSKLRRTVANAHFMSNIVLFEPVVNSTVDAFIAQLETRAINRPGEDGVLDFGGCSSMLLM